MKVQFSVFKANRWRVLDQSFLAMFFTFSLIELANVGAGLIDGLIVSNFLDHEAMAAAGIAHPIFSIAGIFGGLLGTGMQTLCSRELGRGDIGAFNRIFSAVMILGTAFSLVLTAALLLWAEPLAMFLGASGKGASLVKPAAQYLRGIGIGLPGLIMVNALALAVQMDSGRKRVVTSSLLYSGLNVALDLGAVFLHLGMFGIGLATSLALYVQITCLFLHFLAKDSMLRFVRLRTDVREMLSLVYNGTEKALRRVGSVVRPVLVNKLIIFYGGSMAMTAMSVRSNLCDFSQLFAVGLADTAAMLVGVLFGEKNDEGIREAGSCLHRACLIFCGAVCLLFFIFAEPLAGLYISERGEIFDMTVFAVRMIALQAPVNGFLRPRITYLQAVDRTRNMQALIILSSLVYIVLSAFILGLVFGPYGVLACFLVSDLLSLATIWLYYAVRTRKLFPTPEDYMALPRNFYRSPGEVILLDVQDEEDISLVSEQIQLFCKGHGIDMHTGYEAAVCFEELAVNIIRHGFPYCKGEPGIDLRVVYDPEALIIRMQDNCPHFNVESEIARMVSQGKAGPDDYLGLKVLAGMVKDIKYVHSLETNNVILRLPLKAKKA